MLKEYYWELIIFNITIIVIIFDSINNVLKMILFLDIYFDNVYFLYIFIFKRIFSKKMTRILLLECLINLKVMFNLVNTYF